MKRISLVLPVLIGGIFSLSSCNQSSSPNNGGGAVNSGLTATVNGTAWTPTSTGPGDEYVGSDTVIDFSGANDSTYLDIRIQKYLPFGDTGTYSFTDPYGNPSDTAGGTYSLHSVFYEPIPNSGTIRLTVWTASHITATFQFKAKDPKGDSVVITNGALDMDY